MPAARKSATARRMSGATKGSKAGAQPRARPKAPGGLAAEASIAERSVRATTRRSTTLSQLQAELRRAVARIAALEVVLRVTPQGDVTIAAGSGLTLQAATEVSVEGPRLRLGSGFVRADGVLKCETLVATSVVAASYTPGAGNLI